MDNTRPHIVDGEFQSDKYPTCPRGKVPLSIKDLTAQELLWEYAQRRREVDTAFADDLEFALEQAGYVDCNVASFHFVGIDNHGEAEIALELDYKRGTIFLSREMWDEITALWDKERA